MEIEKKIEAPGVAYLAATLHRPDRPTEGGVVVCHGMLSSKASQKHSRIARGLCGRGYLALRFDFSGRGESPGDLIGLTFTRQLGECLAAVEALRREGARRVALVGSSMGGAVAVMAAARGGVAALATMAAVGHTDLLPERAVGQKGVALWKRKGSILLDHQRVGYAWVEDARKIDLISEAAKIDCPWLIMHGECDDVVPPSDGADLQAACRQRAELEIVPGADHRFSDDNHRDYVAGRIVDFIAGNLS
ncbi:MAG TPA: alpha/beta fold hydrolase [Myxococcota bacterium]|nr:alpha/beta fold hydrolase [Myxococcota bacterium]